MINKLKSNLIKIRTWGVTGVINYLQGYRHRHRIQKKIISSQINCIPSRGITVIGEFSRFGSASKTLRDFVFALRDAGIPFQTYNTDNSPEIPSSDYIDIITPPEEFAINRYNRIVEILPSIVPDKIKIHKSRIAFWEFESGFLYGYPDMVTVESVIAMSDFNASYFRNTLPSSVSVVKILYPFNYRTIRPNPPSTIREKYKINDNEFTVYFNFDFGAAFNRKNPDGVMKAFAKAFKSIPNARLIFKTKSASSHKARVEELYALSESLGIKNRFTMINDHISLQEVFDLVNACDVYISLHRGEGFGMTVAEAMAMGKPVVSTDWSATTEFCKHDCTIPVPYKLVSVKPEQIDHPYYKEVEAWAEPDIDAAADALLKLYENPLLRNELGRKAAAFIRNYFSVDNFRKSINAFLDGTVP